MPASQNKRAMFVRVKLPNDSYAFLDVTKHIGDVLPFEKPVATCAMEVFPNVVAFSLMHLNKHSSKIMKERELGFPVGAVERLRRKGGAHVESLGVDEIVVSGDWGTSTFKLIRKDDGRVALEGDDATFELTRKPSNIDMYMRSPGTGRILAVRFGGHFGSAGVHESSLRATAKVIRSISGLGSFKALSGITAIEMPQGTHTANRINKVVAVENLSRDIDVRLLDQSASAVIGEGKVTVDVDMSDADPATTKFLFHIRAGIEIADVWNHDYQVVLGTAVERYMERYLQDEAEAMIFAIVLGELTDVQLQQLDRALWTVPALDITPIQFRPQSG